MLQHQIEFAKAMTEIYKPISGRMSDPETLKVDGNPDGIRACEEYEAVVKDLQETLQPELEMIETRVIRPATELLDVIKVIRKTATKREHKKLDYDRHRNALKKLQEKKDKSSKDEKAMWKVENDLELATQEYNYYNDLLKAELPKLFELEREFIQPLFQSFYYMQLNIFYTLHERMQRVDIGYFDLTLDVEEAFIQKRGDIQERAEALTITRFRTTGRLREPKYQRPGAGAIEGSKPAGLLTAGTSSAQTLSTSPTATSPATATATTSTTTSASSKFPAYNPSTRPSWQQQSSDSVDSPPPPYSSPGTTPGIAKPLSTTASSLAAAAAAKSKPKPPPPPKPKPARLAAPKVETVTALYDFSAQAEGDLSFRAGDVIEVVQRTQNENEWWTGRLNGVVGQFPGKFASYEPGQKMNN